MSQLLALAPAASLSRSEQALGSGVHSTGSLIHDVGVSRDDLTAVPNASPSHMTFKLTIAYKIWDIKTQRARSSQEAEGSPGRGPNPVISTSSQRTGTSAA